ncbi:MAG: 6-bladed beta-propeller [Proteobacteria bacterium]|nr:6-bladed beta-propeller [Pseudomonadota bacterium]
MTADGDTVYVSDVTGNVVKAYQITTSGFSYLRSFGSGSGSGAGQFNGPEQVAVVGNYVYITDYYNNRIQRFDKATGAYVSQFGSAGSGAGQLNAPSGLVYNPVNGNLYVSEVGNDRVQIFTTTGTYVSQFGSPGAGNGQLNDPYALAVDARGNIYAADSNNNRVVKFDATGAFLRTVAFTTTPPYGVAVDRADKVWLTIGANELYAYDTRGNYRSYYYGTITPTWYSGYITGVRGIAVTQPLPIAPFNGAPVVIVADGTSGSLQAFTQSAQPTAHPSIANFAGLSGYLGAVAYDSAENVYVTAYSLNSVFKFDKFGKFLLQWGGTGNGNGKFSGAYGIAIDDSDNVYVVDNGNDRIQKFSASGAYQSQWGTAGTGDGQFSGPGAIATDGNWIYVSDEGNNRVQKFSLAGAYVRQWGVSGSANGQFNVPAGIAVDRKRNQVYVAEFFGNRVQQFTVYGDFIKVFADSTSGTGKLTNPVGLAVDQHGNVYVADRGNNRVVQYNDNGTYLIDFASANANAIGVNPRNAQIHVGASTGGVVGQYGAVTGKSDTVGVYRPSNQTFYLRNTLSAGSPDITASVAGANGADLPIVGDWNGDGIDTAGLYRPSTATFYLWDRWTGLDVAKPDYSFVFGAANSLPEAGDWNGDGRDGVGVFQPGTGTHLLKDDLIAGAAVYAVAFGASGDKPAAGDWNQDGAGSVAVYRPVDGRFHATNRNISAVAPEELGQGMGNSTDLPVVGDWTHAGYAGFGVFRPSTATFILDTRDRAPDSMFGSGFEAPSSFSFGTSGDLPVAGAWGSPAE